MRKLNLYGCPGYYECEGIHHKVSPYVYFWDCRCGVRKHWIVRFLFRQWGNTFFG